MSRRLSAIAVSTLVLSCACGSQLSEDERARAIAAHTRGAAQVTDNVVLSAESRVTTNARIEAGTIRSGDRGSTTAAGRAMTKQDTTTATTRRCDAPEQPGLTDDRIVIATLADVSGLQPGVFQGAHFGAKAAAAYINAQGGICGRQVDPLLLDTKTDAGGNRAAMIDACTDAFAVAGSMSAFDDGSARPGEECGIPDISAITTTRAKYETSNTFPANPNSPAGVSDTNARFIAKRFPGAVKKAAILWLNIAIGKATADARRETWESAGFEFVYATEVQLLEANYTRYVSEMERRGVQYVHFIGDFQNMVRMQKTMRQQNYVPQVRDFDSITYDPDYLRSADIVEGSFTFMNQAMFEEPGDEMSRLLEWLQRTSPGVRPDPFALYAWSAYRLFERVATRLGPRLSRANVLHELKATANWDGNGLHGPHRIGAKLPTTCNLYLVATGGRFKRMFPARGFDCSGNVFRR